MRNLGLVSILPHPFHSGHVVKIVLLLAVIVLSAAGGYYYGEHQRLTISKSLYDSEQARLAAERNLIDIMEKLNAEAQQDPDAERLSFGTNSLRRLNQVR